MIFEHKSAYLRKRIPIEESVWFIFQSIEIDSVLIHCVNLYHNLNLGLKGYQVTCFKKKPLNCIWIYIDDWWNHSFCGVRERNQMMLCVRWIMFIYRIIFYLKANCMYILCIYKMIEIIQYCYNNIHELEQLL